MYPLVIRTVIVYIIVIAAMRLMGKRQIGELQPSELVTTFLLSNIASLSIAEPDLPLISSVIPILLIACLEVINSTIAWYFPSYATALSGKPVTVIRNGEIDRKALQKLRITGSDLTEAMHSKDIFSPEEVAWGVIESNGSISITPSEGAPVMLPLVVDGIIYKDNLKALKLERSWLDDVFKRNRLNRKQVLLLLYDGNKEILIKKIAAPKDGNPQL